AWKRLEDGRGNRGGWEWGYLKRLCKVEPLVLQDKTEVYGVAFSPDGERLASGNGEGAITIWNSRTGKAAIQLFQAHSDAVVSVAFHRDGKHLASRGADGKLKVWDLTATSKPVWTEPCDEVRKYGSAYTIAFSRDGRLLAAATGGGVVKVWDWKKNQVLYSLPGHIHDAIPVAFSGDGRLAATAREGVKLWDL